MDELTDLMSDMEAADLLARRAEEANRRRKAVARIERLNLMSKLWRHIKTNEIRDDDENLVQVTTTNYRLLCEQFGWEVPEEVDIPEHTSTSVQQAVFKKEFTAEELAAIEERRRTLLPPS